MNAPCKDCENRNETCHSTCELYLNWRTKHNEKKKQEYAEKQAERWLYEISYGKKKKK